MSDSVVVIARARAREGSADAVMEAMREVMPPTHAETGCVRYAAHRSVDDPQVFYMIERWTSKDSLDEHLATAHVQAFFAAISPLVEAPPELTILRPISDELGPIGSL